MKEIIKLEIKNFMSTYLLPEQLDKLDFILEKKFNSINVTPAKKDYKEKNRDKNFYINKFIDAKKVEACSPRTAKYYSYILNMIFKSENGDIRVLNTDNIRDLLRNYQEQHKCSSLSLDNIRRVLSSFYNWLEEECYIIKSPLRRIHQIKKSKEIKEGFTEDEIEKIKNSCVINFRDRCIIDLLLYSGLRVGELVLLNKSSINFDERSCIVFGKGAKERRIYFNHETKLFLLQYLETRTDNNPALFVTKRVYSEKKEPRRLSINSVEAIIRKVGEATNIKNVHPHRFRRTMATKAIDKGMPIEQVQYLLGHATIDTTLRYARVKDKNVMISYQKIIC